MKNYLRIESDANVFFVRIKKTYEAGISWIDVCIYKECNFFLFKFKKSITSYSSFYFKDDCNPMADTYYIDLANAAVNDYLISVKDKQSKNILEKKQELVFDSFVEMQRIKEQK